MARKVASPSDRQVSLLELFLDDLPAADSLLTVDRGDTAAVDLEVRREAVSFGPKCVVQLLGLRSNRGEGSDIADGLSGGESGVGDEGASELVETLADLEVASVTTFQ